MAVILFFGRLSELSDPLNVDIPASVKTADDLTLWLGETYPALKTTLGQAGNRIAINHMMALGTDSVTHADEIAFMSPLSGG